MWSLDNWIYYCASYSTRIRNTEGGLGVPDRPHALGEYGITQDEYGRDHL